MENIVPGVLSCRMDFGDRKPGNAKNDGSRRPETPEIRKRMVPAGAKEPSLFCLHFYFLISLYVFFLIYCLIRTHIAGRTPPSV